MQITLYALADAYTMQELRLHDESESICVVITAPPRIMKCDSALYAYTPTSLRPATHDPFHMTVLCEISASPIAQGK